MDKKTNKPINPNTTKRIVNIFLFSIFIVLIIVTVRTPNFTYAKDKSAWIGMWGAITFVYFIFMCAVISGNNRTTKINQLPTLTSNAKLISKSIEVKGRFTSTYYFLTFEFENGTRKSFKVKHEYYDTILENENGLLTYKEKDKLIEFIDFNRNIDSNL